MSKTILDKKDLSEAIQLWGEKHNINVADYSIEFKKVDI